MKSKFDLKSILGDKCPDKNSYLAFAKFASLLTRNIKDNISGNFDIFIEQMTECFRQKARLD